MTKKKEDQTPAQRPAQHQNRQPGLETLMQPRPEAEDTLNHGSGKLAGQAALITGGDSGIGKAVAIAFAKEGADIAILYLNEHEDARATQREVEAENQRCLLIAGDVGDPGICRRAVERVMTEYGRLDVLVNNAAEQHPQERLEDITPEQLQRTFTTNIFGYFYMAQAALPHLPEGGSILNTTSVTAYRGSAHLIDYAATKGAIVAFTRSLSQALAERKIRVNAVAPGPVWTPLIASTFPAQEVATFGADAPLAHAAEPREIAPSYVFLASRDGAYFTGQVLHPNGGEIVNA